MTFIQYIIGPLTSIILVEETNKLKMN